jgi:hypothetical protein
MAQPFVRSVGFFQLEINSGNSCKAIGPNKKRLCQ